MARRGRPCLPDDQRPVAHNVRLSPDISDTVYKLAHARGISQYQFLGDLIERVITLHKSRHPHLSCYRAEESGSTLGTVLSDPSA